MGWLGGKKTALPPAIDCVLQTPRLTLRPATMDDLAQWQTVRGLNQAYLKPYEPTWPEQALDQEFFARRVARLTQDWRDDRTYSFLILREDRLIGGININNVTRGAAQYAALGYWLDEMSQGNGYMTEAGAAVLHYAFVHLGLQRMNAAALPANRRSRAMLARLGFAEEGFAKAYIQINGQRQDHVLYGLNADDYISALNNSAAQDA